MSRVVSRWRIAYAPVCASRSAWTKQLTTRFDPLSARGWQDDSDETTMPLKWCTQTKKDTNRHGFLTDRLRHAAAHVKVYQRANAALAAHCNCPRVQPLLLPKSRNSTNLTRFGSHFGGCRQAFAEEKSVRGGRTAQKIHDEVHGVFAAAWLQDFGAVLQAAHSVVQAPLLKLGVKQVRGKHFAVQVTVVLRRVPS